MGLNMTNNLNVKNYYKEKFPNLYNKILETEKILDNKNSLYHATTLSNAKSILKEGLNVEHCGKIHGTMEIRPNVKTTYLSKLEYSNNLNSNLFDSKEKIIVLEINPEEINIENIYPDDGMFCGFATEQYLEDENEVSEVFNIPLDEATEFFNELCTKTNDEFAEFVKPLWSLYLVDQGEISISQDLKPISILSAKDYLTGENIPLSSLDKDFDDLLLKTINKINQPEKTKAFMKEFDEEFDNSEFGNFTEVRLLIEKDKIEIDTIWVHENINQGHGSAALKLITDLADKHKVALTLSSSPLRYDAEYCTNEEFTNNDKFLDNESLINFYKKNGFIMDNKFKQGNKDNPEQPRMIRHSAKKQTLKIKP
jgi:hypothetical protein